ncbi:hypothetical protein SAMN05421771_0156 [Granulicella pectinivorans]|uniref:Uncharacterized protein n=1 Tax=Granulicella pectinivorans TaxID=474950 RepID=A0A1I6L2H5_9BACT|nr:hypothetical protein [Granulicella pectinivorans]SFR97642.1 hypothetical protein SAMN05421771_0156 [Granulicella pectinivorans]
MTRTLYVARPATHLVRRWMATTDPRRPLTSVWVVVPRSTTRPS